MNEWIKSSPKANQHLHLTGALTFPYIRERASELNLPLDEYEPLETSHFDSPDIWSLTKELTSTPEGFLDAMKHVVDVQAEDNVELVELTFNPYGMLRRGMTKEEIADAVNSAYVYAQSRGMQFFVRPGVNRKDGSESIVSVTEVYNAIDEAVRWGIDLNGDERQFPTEPFVAGFKYLADQGIRTSMHAGEFDNLAVSLEVTLKARPYRISHAVAAASRPHLLRKIKNQGIVIEIASLSNLARGSIVPTEIPPAITFIEQGINVVFGTDDPTFFNNTMSDEFRFLNESGVSRLGLETMMAEFKQRSIRNEQSR